MKIYHTFYTPSWISIIGSAEKVVIDLPRKSAKWFAQETDIWHVQGAQKVYASWIGVKKSLISSSYQLFLTSYEFEPDSKGWAAKIGPEKLEQHQASDRRLKHCLRFSVVANSNTKRWANTRRFSEQQLKAEWEGSPISLTLRLYRKLHQHHPMDASTLRCQFNIGGGIFCANDKLGQNETLDYNGCAENILRLCWVMYDIWLRLLDMEYLLLRSSLAGIIGKTTKRPTRMSMCVEFATKRSCPLPQKVSETWPLILKSDITSVKWMFSSGCEGDNPNRGFSDKLRTLEQRLNKLYDN